MEQLFSDLVDEIHYRPRIVDAIPDDSAATLGDGGGQLHVHDWNKPDAMQVTFPKVRRKLD